MTGSRGTGTTRRRRTSAIDIQAAYRTLKFKDVPDAGRIELISFCGGQSVMLVCREGGSITSSKVWQLAQGRGRGAANKDVMRMARREFREWCAFLKDRGTMAGAADADVRGLPFRKG